MRYFFQNLLYFNIINENVAKFGFTFLYFYGIMTLKAGEKCECQK